MKKNKICIMLPCFLLLLSGCGNTDSVPDRNLPELAETVSETLPETEPETEFIWTEPPTDPPAPGQVFINCMPVVEANRTLTVADFVTFSNVMLKDDTAQVDTGRTGTFEITIPYYYGKETREQTVSYQVKDTTPPVILSDSGNAFIKTGDPFDPRELVGYGDNYDTALTLTYDGDVDTTFPGVYMLSVHVTDSSGNQSTCRLNVTVGDEKPSFNAEKPLAFADFKKQYAKDLHTFAGIDVSSWQGDIDYDALVREGCEFVLIRIGKSYNDVEEDDYFDYNFKAARNAGLKVGVYFYSADNNEGQIRYDADWIARKLNGAKLDFPVAFDWEEFSDFQKYEINFGDLNRLYRIFEEQMGTHGYETMLYSSKFFLENVWENPDRYPVWLAHYAEQTDYSGKYSLWQRSSKGRIDGIDGYADFNVFTEIQETSEISEENLLTESS